MPGFRTYIAAAILGMILSAAALANKMVVTYTGDRPDKEVAGVIERLAGRSAADSIGVILSEAGYLDSRINQRGDTITVDAGKRFRLGEIELSIVDDSGHVRAKNIGGFAGMAANVENMTTVGKQILEPYQMDGYYFASLTPERIERRDGAIMPQLKLVTGPVVTIRRLRFKGLKKTNPAFVGKLSGLKEGETFNENRLHSAVRRIENGAFLRNDSIPEITPNENYDGVEVLFYLTEEKSNSLELGGGYLPGRGAEKSEFVGRMHFDSRNLFGSGRRISLFLDRKDRASSQVEFRFGQPLFVPDHLELGLHLAQVDYDSSYHSFTIDGSIGLYTAGNTRLSAGLSWNRTEPQRSSQPPSRTLAGVAAYERQNFDYAPNPSGGKRLEFELSYLRRTSWPDTVATAVINNESVFAIGIDNYLNAGYGLVLRLNLESKVRITSRDLIDYSEQFKLGGYGSLRGYRHDQFAGRRIFLGQSEIRLRPSQDMAFYIFGDFGYVYDHQEISPGMVISEDITRVGSGLGLFVGGPSARMNMEIGWGEHDSLDQGKIHFGLVTLF